MDILVLGNGFDLAHNLPTKYADFLEFVRVIRALLTGKSLESVDWGTLNPRIKFEITINIKKSIGSIHENKEDWLKLIGDNIWVEYFNQTFIKENWIDFENEIASIIQTLDADMFDVKNKRLKLKNEMQKLSEGFLLNCYMGNTFVSQVATHFLDPSKKSERVTFEEIRDRLLTDLNKLIRALEIYLSDYINKIKVSLESPDIKGTGPDKILSFNYTNTYARVYAVNKDIEYDYIHGKADLDNNEDTNNLVLGIDEYLPDDKRNQEVDFIAFKKYYQRIHKETGCRYKNWVSEIKSNYIDYLIAMDEDKKNKPIYSDSVKIIRNNKEFDFIERQGYGVHKLTIFGHSLDVTDKDILRDLILNDNVDTTIYFYDKEVYGQQISNLVKVIGPDELIRRTGGPTKTITFKQQSNMVSVTQ